MLTQRFQAHCDATDLRFAGEAEDRYKMQCALRESLSAWTSVSDREEAASTVRAVQGLKSAKDMLEGEASKREAADVVVLESLQKAMQDAQQIVLHNFGKV